MPAVEIVTCPTCEGQDPTHCDCANGCVCAWCGNAAEHVGDECGCCVHGVPGMLCAECCDAAIVVIARENGIAPNAASYRAHGIADSVIAALAIARRIRPVVRGDRPLWVVAAEEARHVA